MKLSPSLANCIISSDNRCKDAAAPGISSEFVLDLLFVAFHRCCAMQTLVIKAKGVRCLGSREAINQDGCERLFKQPFFDVCKIGSM
jgi:hypothetical protein